MRGVSDGDHGVGSSASGERGRQEQRDEGGALAEHRGPHVLVGGVRTVADSPQAVERGGVLADGVAVGRATDGRLLEWEARAAGQWPAAVRQSAGCVGPARAEGGRKLPETSIEVPGIDRLQPSNGRLDARRVLAGGRAHVQTRAHFGRHDVRAKAAVDGADVDA